jgi:3-methyladenine DNA glycosylase AlkC
MSRNALLIPEAPKSILKGSTLKDLLDRPVIDCLAHNIALVHPKFDARSFRRAAMDGLEPLPIMARGQHLSRALRRYLPADYETAVQILLGSLPPPPEADSSKGLSGFFFLPYSAFIAEFGAGAEGGGDTFETSMRAQYAITRLFTAEFCMRPFLIKWPERTIARLMEWTRDADENVRRLCSEGSRPRLPWGMRIPAFIKDPSPTLPILETLKDDPSLYVQRSVANHLGDIAKDHPRFVFELCERWVEGADKARKWLIRHAVRLPAKKGIGEALRLRRLAAP